LHINSTKTILPASENYVVSVGREVADERQANRHDQGDIHGSLLDGGDQKAIKKWNHSCRSPHMDLGTIDGARGTIGFPCDMDRAAIHTDCFSIRTDLFAILMDLVATGMDRFRTEADLFATQ